MRANDNTVGENENENNNGEKKAEYKQRTIMNAQIFSY